MTIGKFRTKFFRKSHARWGPHTIDRFANHQNKQLTRFNSTFSCPGSKHMDHFSLLWHGENNWVVPPIYLIPRVINHIVATRSSGTLVVPKWPSSVFWPFVCETRDKVFTAWSFQRSNYQTCTTWNMRVFGYLKYILDTFPICS